MPRLTSGWTFKLRGHGLTRVLGSLEAEVMREVWRQGDTTIRRVWEALSAHRPLAFNSVMTVMNRLTEKGLLIRRGHTRSYRFRPRESHDAFMARISHALAQGLIRDFGDHAVAQFVRALRTVDPQKLAALRHAVAEMPGTNDTVHTGVPAARGRRQ